MTIVSHLTSHFNVKLIINNNNNYNNNNNNKVSNCVNLALLQCSFVLKPPFVTFCCRFQHCRKHIDYTSVRFTSSCMNLQVHGHGMFYSTSMHVRDFASFET